MAPSVSRPRETRRSWMSAAAVGLLWASSLVPAVMGTYTPYLTQGFFFDWTPPDQSPPVPTTAQCDTIHIVYQRGNAVGPNPVAPYYLHIFTSTFIVPLIVEAGTSDSDLSFDFPVPFVPGTQYQICMFDSLNTTGGCQDIYTVYPAANHTLDNPPTCRNLTYPQPSQVLGVTALVDNGPLGEYAWIDQCTDISLKPTNGTPPYKMTVAPALHPPYQLHSNTMDAINWTVSLSWGMPFWVSLEDSTGMLWSFGPLHSGQGTTSACLAGTDASASSKEVQPWVAAVSGVGGLIVGLVVGLLGAIFFLTRQRRRQHDRVRPDMLHRKSSSMSITTPVLAHQEPYTDAHTPPPDSHLLRDQSYHIEPFVMPSDREIGLRPSGSNSAATTLLDSTSHTHTRNQSLTLSGDRSRSPTSSIVSPTTSAGPSHAMSPLQPPHRALASENRSSSQVFVVHHDGGRPPVTVYTADGTEIVELPPRYIESSSGAGGSTSEASVRTGPVPPLQVQERRQTGALPAKQPQRRVVS